MDGPAGVFLGVLLCDVDVGPWGTVLAVPMLVAIETLHMSPSSTPCQTRSSTPDTPLARAPCAQQSIEPFASTP